MLLRIITHSQCLDFGYVFTGSAHAQNKTVRLYGGSG